MQASEGAYVGYGGQPCMQGLILGSGGASLSVLLLYTISVFWFTGVPLVTASSSNVHVNN